MIESVLKTLVIYTATVKSISKHLVRYQKDSSPAQKEELARLHETIHILPVFN